MTCLKKVAKHLVFIDNRSFYFVATNKEMFIIYGVGKMEKIISIVGNI